MKTYKYHYVYTITNPTILDENNNPKVSISIRSVDCKPEDDNFYGTAKITAETPKSKLIKKIISIWKTKEEAKKAKNKIYHQLNSVKVSQRKKKYYVENIDKIMEYKSTNKERINKRQAEYYDRNKMEINARKKIYAQENADKIKERKRQYYIDNKEVITIRNNIYNSKNIELVKERKRAYAQSNKGKSKQSDYYRNNKQHILDVKRKAKQYKNIKIASEKIKLGKKGDDWIFYTILFTHKATLETFYKYGITKRTIEERFYSYNDFNYNILDVIYGDEQYVRVIEKLHLSATKSYKYEFSNKIKFGDGYTECRTKLAESITINVK